MGQNRSKLPKIDRKWTKNKKVLKKYRQKCTNPQKLPQNKLEFPKSGKKLHKKCFHQKIKLAQMGQKRAKN